MLTLGCIVLLMAVALIVGSLNITLPCRVYLAIPMTGYDKQEMIQISKQAIFLAKQYGLDAWSPVVYEGVCGRGKLEADTTLTEKWAMDKVALRYKCFVFLNLQADNKSFGCERELGLIAQMEDDVIVGDLHTAFRTIRDKWGTWPKRRMWQIKMVARSLPRWLGVQFVGLGL
jgi:hypothetical protein